MNIALRSSYVIWPYLFMLVVGMMVPSTASHGLFSIKSLAFLATIGSVAIYFLMKQKLNLKYLKALSFLLIFVALLLLWMLIGAYHNTYELKVCFDQFKLFIITIAVPACTLYLLSEKQITPQQVIKVIILANFCYCLLKVALVAAHFGGFLDIWAVKQRLGIRVMAMGIFGKAFRFQTSVDISTPFVLLFVLQSDRLNLNLGRKTKIFYILISFLSNCLAFSRLLLFIYVASFSLYIFTENISRMFKASICGLLIVASFIGAIGIDNFVKAVEVRLLSKANFLSDKARYTQVESLLIEHEQYPYLGKGLGGHTEDVRDKDLKHSYEVQWVAFLMQFGIFGVFILVLFLGMIGVPLLFPPFSRVKGAFFALFVMWVLSGFTNPFLISLQSGVIYTLFLITPEGLKNTKEREVL